MGEIAAFSVAEPHPTYGVIEVFGGDNNLTDYVRADLQEMVEGANGSVGVLALADFRRSGAQVVEIARKAGGQRVVERLGEINTGDSETLAAFLARALVTYEDVPHVAIGFWDHGSGVFDEEDPHEAAPRSLRKVRDAPKAKHPPARRLFAPKDRRLRAMLHDKTNGDLLTNYEAHLVVRAALNRAGRKRPVDLMFSDTCLNGMIEVVEQFSGFADVVIGSEELEPGDGWDYTGWFSRMADQPPADASAWARQAVRSYERAYRDLPEEHPCTLGAFKASNGIAKSFKALIGTIKKHGTEGFGWIRDARDQTQSFADSDTYDLNDFAVRIAKATSDATVRAASGRLAAAVAAARVDSCALGELVEKSSGLAFWCPNGKTSYRRVGETYRKLEFDKAVGWTKYLRPHYAN